MNPIVIEEFVAVERNTLRGFCRARMPSGVIYHDVGIHQKDGAAWAIPASKPRLDRNGQQTRDAAGKPQWTPIVSFVSKELRDKFSISIIDALKLSHPSALP